MLEKIETVLTVLMGFVFSIVICSVTFGLLYLSTGLIEARFDEADRIEDEKRINRQRERDNLLKALTELGGKQCSHKK